MAKKRQSDESSVAVEGLPTKSARGKRTIAAIAAAVGVVGGGGFYIWNQVRDHVSASGQYQVLPEHITITPPPKWIRANIREEVLADAQAAGPLSLLDSQLTVRMASAFAAHPWVAKVDRVSKHFPSGLDVVLQYRTPVAMVEVQNGSGVLPVDVQAVVLPTRDFTPDEAEHYPRITEIHTMPAGPVGSRWGDACVLGGAQVAAALGPDWRALNLAKIVPVERKAAKTGVEYTFALVTHTGTMVHWGRAPGTDTAGEVPANEKISQLKLYASKNDGSLDGPDGPQQIEIDGRGALLRKARPAVTPLPNKDE